LLQNAHALLFLHYSAFGTMLLHELHWLAMSPAERTAHEAEQLRKQQKRRARREAALWAAG
jgi:hypothetical protein